MSFRNRVRSSLLRAYISPDLRRRTRALNEARRKLTGKAHVVTAFLHLLRVFYTGGFKKGRSTNWLIGIALLLLVVAFLVTTTSGARWLLDLATGKAPGEITVARVEGRLLGPLHL